MFDGRILKRIIGDNTNCPIYPACPHTKSFTHCSALLRGIHLSLRSSRYLPNLLGLLRQHKLHQIPIPLKYRYHNYNDNPKYNEMHPRLGQFTNTMVSAHVPHKLAQRPRRGGPPRSPCTLTTPDAQTSMPNPRSLMTSLFIYIKAGLVSTSRAYFGSFHTRSTMV